MIAPLKKIDPLIPVFTEYLAHMSQFFPIAHYESWRERALKNLHRYFPAEDRHAFIMEESGVIMGFALVNSHLRFNPKGLAVAEFYVQKNQEGKGHGRRLAEHLFDLFPGPWEVAVTSANTPALGFWEKVVAGYTQRKFLKKKSLSFTGFVFTTEPEELIP